MNAMDSRRAHGQPGQYLALREVGAAAGKPYNAPIAIQLAGPANKGPDSWKPEWDDLAPNVALAWTPNPADGLLRKLLGP